MIINIKISWVAGPSFSPFQGTGAPESRVPSPAGGGQSQISGLSVWRWPSQPGKLPLYAPWPGVSMRSAGGTKQSKRFLQYGGLIYGYIMLYHLICDYIWYIILYHVISPLKSHLQIAVWQLWAVLIGASIGMLKSVLGSRGHDAGKTPSFSPPNTKDQSPSLWWGRGASKWIVTGVSLGTVSINLEHSPDTMQIASNWLVIT